MAPSTDTPAPCPYWCDRAHLPGRPHRTVTASVQVGEVWLEVDVAGDPPTIGLSHRRPGEAEATNLTPMQARTLRDGLTAAVRVRGEAAGR